MYLYSEAMRSISGTSASMFHVCPEVTQGRAEDGVRPITVQEIQEALRRHAAGVKRTISMYKNTIDRPCTMPYLAI